MISGRQLAVTPATPPARSLARTNSPRMINDVAGSDWTPLVIFKLWRISGCLPPLAWLTIYNQPNYRGAAWLAGTGLAAPYSRLRHQAGWLEMGNTGGLAGGH